MATDISSSPLGDMNSFSSLINMNSMSQSSQELVSLLGSNISGSTNAYLHPSVVQLLTSTAPPMSTSESHQAMSHMGNSMLDNSISGDLPPSSSQGLSAAATLASLMDARRMRKSVFRRTIDYNAPVMNHMENRIWMKDPRNFPAIQSDYLYQAEMPPVFDCLDNPYVSITTKHVRTSTNKNKCPIYCVCWTPEGRRLITGAHSGEFTLWNGLTFNFETILQAHDHPIRAMKWTNNEEWLITADQTGFVKYWQTNMNNVTAFSAHKDSAIRGVSFCPTDEKFVTCSDDATVRVWDFYTHVEERVLRGHGADVRCVAWHPQASLVISGSKDAQQPIKLWDPKVGESVLTLYAHKNTCTDVAWNKNGNWFITSSRDHLIKMFDLRYLKQPMETFRGHKRDVMRLAWHPFHENMFTSGSGDGAILFWLVGNEKNVGSIDDAHESMIWSLAWHPMGHILVSGANDFTTKFWTRNRPGDLLRDTATLQGVHAPILQASDGTSTNNSPQKVVKEQPVEVKSEITITNNSSLDRMISGDTWPELPTIPGLGEGQVIDHHHNENIFDEYERIRTLRASRAIPKQFMVNWASAKHASMPSAIGMGSGGMGLIGTVAAQTALPPAPRARMMPGGLGTPHLPIRRGPPSMSGMRSMGDPRAIMMNRMRMPYPRSRMMSGGGYPMRPMPPRMMMRGPGRPYNMHSMRGADDMDNVDLDQNYGYGEEMYSEEGGYDEYEEDYGDESGNYDTEMDYQEEAESRFPMKDENIDMNGKDNNHQEPEQNAVHSKNEPTTEEYNDGNDSAMDTYHDNSEGGPDNQEGDRYSHSHAHQRRMSGPDRHPYPPYGGGGRSGRGLLRPPSRGHPGPMYNQGPRRQPMYPPSNQYYYPRRPTGPY